MNKKLRPTQATQWTEKCRFRSPRFAVIKNTRQEQQTHSSTFRLSCLPNENGIENLKFEVFFEINKCMNKKLRPTQATQWTEKCRFRSPRFAVIKNTRQEQQNQRTTI